MVRIRLRCILNAGDKPELHPVLLRDVGTEVFLAYLQHLDGLLHEIKLVDAGTATGMARVGPELAKLIAAIVDVHADAFSTAREQAAAAQDRGDPTFDLSLALPAEAGTAATDLIAHLDHADELADQGLLLALAASPAVRELRHRLRDQVVSQLPTGTADSDR